ncbi:hypothetical protein SDC9_185180 [bioreactor metagenome]|uniref:Uncharacterized protein n=1 Tax=bioreactor metagenome TaxID=1076179 RepID=A0A645HG02_9ZZZZ
MTLEALSPGNVSEVGSMDYWQYFSNFAILRLKGVSYEERAKIADYARENLAELPYNIIAGVFDFSNKSIPKSTQCAFVVFDAYKRFGYDIDSDGGRIVTVRDLLASDKLEVIQIYGLDPEDYIERIY